MISDFLSKRPTEKTTKYLLFFSFPLLIITASAVMYLLKLSNFPGTLNETQLGFNGEYIKSCKLPKLVGDSFFPLDSLLSFHILVFLANNMARSCLKIQTFLFSQNPS